MPMRARSPVSLRRGRCAAYCREMLGQSSGIHCWKEEFRDSEAGEVDSRRGQPILFGSRTGQTSSFHVADNRRS